jgi:cytochrome b subunit of formate dehydrogenase
MLRWFLGLQRKPRFERWTYWEKLDYWAFYLAAGLIGISGLMLWYPNPFCLIFPGSVLNVAQLVHSEFAIYVASFLFLIHFFHAHFRPEKFPMDLSVLTGLVSLEHLRKYRPEYVARLEREGKLDQLRRAAPSSRRLWFNVFGGLLVFSLGLCLLAVTLLASLSE